MIASWFAKRMARSACEKAFAGDVEAAFANMADDAVYDIPIDISAGDTVRGKKAAIEWFHKWYEQFPMRRLIIKNIAFAAWPLSPTNVCIIEWTCEETDKGGREFRYDGTTVMQMRSGKGIRTTEYIACKGLPQLSTLIRPTAKAQT